MSVRLNINALEKMCFPEPSHAITRTHRLTRAHRASCPGGRRGAQYSPTAQRRAAIYAPPQAGGPPLGHGHVPSRPAPRHRRPTRTCVTAGHPQRGWWRWRLTRMGRRCDLMHATLLGAGGFGGQAGTGAGAGRAAPSTGTQGCEGDEAGGHRALRAWETADSSVRIWQSTGDCRILLPSAASSNEHRFQLTWVKIYGARVTFTESI